MDVHNLLFNRLTKLAFLGLPEINTLEGFRQLSGNEVCSICRRNLTMQPKQFERLALVGKNSYKQSVTYCVCCAAFFQNNPDVMGIEKPKAPNTGQKFGMMAGSGALIELNTNRTIFFVPEKSAAKFPKSSLEEMERHDIELVRLTQFEQLSHLADLKLNYPVLWINSFGKKDYKFGCQP